MIEEQDISVVIPSYNGAHKLPVCMGCLEQQSISGFEVVVVLDGSTDHSKTILQSFQHSTTFRLKIVETPNGGRSVARNNGAKAASSSILIFIDDDMEVTPTLVEQHLAAQQQHSGTIVVGNNFRDPAKAKIDFHQFLLQIERSWESDLVKDGPVTLERYFFSSQNFSVPASVFQSIAGFDERLKDAEDFDLGLRALEQGISIVYNSKIIAYHNDWPDLAGYIRRHNQYMHANRKLAEVRPQYLEHFSALLTPTSGKMKRIVLAGFKNTVSKMVLKDRFLFRVLPMSLRYRFYRMAIAAHSDSNALKPVS